MKNLKIEDRTYIQTNRLVFPWHLCDFRKLEVLELTLQKLNTLDSVSVYAWSDIIPSEKLVISLELVQWSGWHIQRNHPSVIGSFCDKVQKHVSKCIDRNVTVVVNLTLNIPSWQGFEGCKEELIDLLAAASVANVKNIKTGQAHYTSLYGRASIKNLFNTVPLAPIEQ